MPNILSGGSAHSRPCATNPAILIKNHLIVIAGWPRTIQIYPRGVFSIVPHIQSGALVFFGHPAQEPES
eukprot:4358085-Pyramimonas_sp.AAC.1